MNDASTGRGDDPRNLRIAIAIGPTLRSPKAHFLVTRTGEVRRAVHRLHAAILAEAKRSTAAVDDRSSAENGRRISR
jgi:hypothetical protein